MKYCLDVSAIPYGTGVARYTRNLATALNRHIQKPDEFTVYGTAFRQYSQLQAAAREVGPRRKFLYRLPPSAASVFWNQTKLPIDWAIGQPDVFHSWDWYLPYARETRLVITIHDLALFKYPDTAHPEIKKHHQLVLSRIKKYRPHIIAVSKSTENDLVSMFGIDPATITVVYEALPEESIFDLSLQDILDVRHKLGVGERPYILMVGTTEPRKNYARQIEAWRQYKKDFDLVIAGRPGWEKIEPEENLSMVGAVSDRDLAALYANAQALMYCSLDEGFGLPILEAFHYKIPVLTSNRSSMAEIVNGSAVTADPEQVESIAAGITACLSQRGELVIKGSLRLNDFSWDKAARETLEVYDSCRH